MNDILTMHILHGSSESHEQISGILLSVVLLRSESREHIAALNELGHDDVVIGLLKKVVHGHDVLVLHSRKNLHLELKLGDVEDIYAI